MHKDDKTMKTNKSVSFILRFSCSFIIPLLFHHCHPKSHANEIHKSKDDFIYHLFDSNSQYKYIMLFDICHRKKVKQFNGNLIKQKRIDFLKK